MKRHWLLVSCGLLAAVAGGCARRAANSGLGEPRPAGSSLAQEKEAILREVQEENRKLLRAFYQDASQFYEETGDAYYLIGLEYYNLSKEMTRTGDKERAERYTQAAKLYYSHSEDLRANADRRRATLRSLEGGAGAPASGPSLADLSAQGLGVSPSALGGSVPPPVRIEPAPMGGGAADLPR